MGKNTTKNNLIIFPFSKKEDWKNYLSRNKDSFKSLAKAIEIDCQDWELRARDFKQINNFFESMGIQVTAIKSNIPQTIVSATAFGYQTIITKKAIENENYLSEPGSIRLENEPKVLFREGTLRSGDTIEAEGDLLLLGDVNPGAKVSAVGNIMIWGRLLGIAHAGSKGNNYSKIIALELRPVQLRIGDKIARGPKEKPLIGLAEEAIIQSDEIVIRPARTNS